MPIDERKERLPTKTEHANEESSKHDVDYEKDYEPMHLVGYLSDEGVVGGADLRLFSFLSKCFLNRET